jgi:hypothetical protein
MNEVSDQATREQDAGFLDLLKRYKLRSLAGQAAGGFSVVSESGKTYKITLTETIDRLGSMRMQWRCTCPARRRCRHIEACEQVEHAEAAASGDIDRLEFLENVSSEGGG